MPTPLELLIRAKQETDTAFKQVIDNMKGAEEAAKKQSAASNALASDLKGQLGSALESMGGKVGGFGQALTSLGPAGMVAAAGVGVLVAAVGAAIKVSVDAAMAAADYDDNLAGLSDKTGLTGQALQNLDVAAKLGNSSLEAVSGAVNKMQLAMAKGSDGFRQMGLSIADLRKMSPDEQFAAVSKALLSIEDQTMRAEVGSKVLGKSWGDLIGTMKAAASGASDLGGALSDDALAASADLKDQTDLLKEAWDRVERQFGAAIASSPELRRGIDDLANAVASMATELAKAAPHIAKFFDNFTNGLRATVSVAKAGGGFFADLFGGKGVLVAGANAAGKVAGDVYMEGMRDSIRKMKNEIGFGEKGKGILGGVGGIGLSDADLAAIERRKKEIEKAAKAENKAREDAAKEWAVAHEKYEKEILKVREDAAEKWAAAKEKYDADALAAQQKHAAAVREVILQAQAEEIAAAKAAVQATVDAWHSFGNFAADLFDLFSSAGLDSFAGIAAAAVQTADMLAQAAQQGYISWAQLGQQVVNVFKQGSAGAGALSGAMTGFAIGGPIGAGIGAVVGGLTGLFGGAAKAKAEMQKLRNEFVQSAGGMAALSAQAKAAGISLDGMFKQKSADALARQIDTIKAKLADWEDAQNLVRDAMEKYGISVSEMGPKFAAQELDKQVALVAKEWAALSLVTGDQVMLASKMGPQVLELVGQYKAAGLAIPAALKPVLQAMLDQGKLVDENGVAYKSFEEAGISFGTTMEGALTNIADQIEKLMRVLAQGFHIPITYEQQNSPNPAGGGGGAHHANPHDEPLGFAGGGIGNFGSGTAAVLHGNEAVLPLDDQTLGRLGKAIAQAMGGGGGGNVRVEASFALTKRQLGKAVTMVSRHRNGLVNPSGIRRQ